MRPSTDVDWEDVTERYRDLVFSIPRKFGLSEHDCGDVFQQTWVIALGKDEAPEETGLAPWLAAIASYAARDVLRKRRPGPLSDEAAELVEDADEPLPAELLAAAEQEQAVREALAELPERDQLILTALYLSESPTQYADLARRLGVAPGSVSMLRQRAIQRFRQTYERAASA
jgi:RNA polymerase sigma factor (sigma-70 family)